MEILFKDMIQAALEAGKEVLKIYEKDFEVFYKEDKTPVTLADKISNKVIKDNLKKYNFFFLSEEEEEKLDYSQRKNIKKLFIVDPLDGTKEFIKKNGEFTINIAFVENNFPVFGVVYAPALKKLYFGGLNFGSFMVEIKGNIEKEKINIDEVLEKSKKIKVKLPEENKLFVCISRSHLNEKTLNFLETLKERSFEIEYKKIGSSLKFCLVAEGKAHLYPRFSPTMEWDTAAGQAVLEGSGGKVIDLKGNRLVYNKENLKNPEFLAFADNLNKIILEDRNCDSSSS